MPVADTWGGLSRLTWGLFLAAFFRLAILLWQTLEIWMFSCPNSPSQGGMWCSSASAVKLKSAEEGFPSWIKRHIQGGKNLWLFCSLPAWNLNVTSGGRAAVLNSWADMRIKAITRRMAKHRNKRESGVPGVLLNSCSLYPAFLRASSYGREVSPI